jgi:hypothetical protein
VDSQFDELTKAASLIGHTVCFGPTQRNERIVSQGITSGTVVNVRLSPRFKGKTGVMRVIYVIEFGPSYHRSTSYFLREDLRFCNGQAPAP